MTYPYEDQCEPQTTGICETCQSDAMTNSCCVDLRVAGGVVSVRTGQVNVETGGMGTASPTGVPVVFNLTTLTQSCLDSFFGPFSYPQDVHLEQTPTGVDLVTPYGGREPYTPLGDGRYSSDGNAAAQLSELPDGTFQLTSRTGVESIFASPTASGPEATPGCLLSQTTPYGDQITYQWAVVCGQVTPVSASGPSGPLLQFGQPQYVDGYKVVAVTDNLGRRTLVQMTLTDQVVAVILPGPGRAPDGATPPPGQGMAFVRDLSNPRPDRRDDILQIYTANQVAPYILPSGVVDMEALQKNAEPTYRPLYGQDATDAATYGRTISLKVGNPCGGVGGTWGFMYFINPAELPENLIDPYDPIVRRTVTTDPNGNQVIYDFNAAGMCVHMEVFATRGKLAVPNGAGAMDGQPPVLATSYVTWTKYNSHNQPLLVIYPEGNSTEYEYDDGTVTGWTRRCDRRVGLLLRRTQRPGNSLGINTPVRGGSGGQSELTELYFYDPLYNRLCASIERRGNPVGDCDHIVTGHAALAGGGSPNGEYSQNGTYNGQAAYERSDGMFWIWWNGAGQWVLSEVEGMPGSGYWQSASLVGQYSAQGTATGTASVGTNYYTPQNGGTTPTDSDRSRYATIRYCDYQKNLLSTVMNDSALQDRLGVTAQEIEDLILHVSGQMQDGGIPAGFEMELGDINGDGSGDGAFSGLPAARMFGDTVKIKHPSVRQLAPSEGGDPWQWATQERVEVFTVNAKGQATTHTDPEGNITVWVRYPENDPQGDGQSVSPTLSTRQYGYVREVHVDCDPNDVMDLVGEDGDLLDFIPKITRTNSPGVYRNLITRYQGAPGGTGCSACGYDALGNVLAQTDPRGFTTTYDRDDLGRAYRVTSPTPYNYRTERYFDAAGNLVREDVEDKQVAYASEDPSDANYAKFIPTGNGWTAHVPTKAGPGGADRPGWFSNYYTYDLLNRKIKDDIDATGSTPSRLVTAYEYDPNGNLVKITKPGGNTVEHDYDERNLRIATRTGYDAALDEPGSVTVIIYDANGNLIDQVGAVDRLGGGGPTSLTVVIEDAFRSGAPMTHVGTWEIENVYDGFDRVIQSIDAAGNVSEQICDPDGRTVETMQSGPAGGASPTDRLGTSNVPLASGQSRYDEAGRQYESQQDVFLNTGVSGGSPTHALASGRAVTHTGGGLEANATTNGHTAVATLTDGDQSYVLNRSVYDRAGRTVASASDNTAVTTIDYDGAGRQIMVTDPKGNTVEMEYDPSGNAVRTSRTELADIANPPEGLQTEVFRSYARYDSLNRLVVSGSQGADGTLSELSVDGCTWPVASQTLVSLVGYDSRSNQTVVIDPKGNTAVSLYDGAGRMIQTVQHLRRDGDGGPPADGATFLPDGGAGVRTLRILDANGRTSQLVDDRGATTLYTYDTLDRQVSMQFQDGSTRTTTYNAASDVVQYVDENGSVFDYVQDALGRTDSLTIDRADAVLGTTAQSFQYDGLSRRTFARDSILSANADCSFAYDSLGRGVEEVQAFSGNTRYVTTSAFASLASSRLAYPNGRLTAYNTDVLYRRTQVVDDPDGTPADVAQWWFFGPSRTAELKLGNGLICTWMNNARTASAVQEDLANPAWGNQSSDRLGYDGAGRMITKRYLNATASSGGYSSTTSLVGFTTAFDMGSNKDYERHLHAENRSHLYPAQDSLGRLGEYQRGTLAQAGDGSVSVATPIALGGADSQRTYDLDTLGNWKKTVYTPVGGSQTTELRRHNYVNQVTRIGSTPVEYDHGDNTGDAARQGNGNVADDGERLYAWDALNRLIQVKRKSDLALIATYTYDAAARRIRKTVANGGLSEDIPNATTDYLYQGLQCVEERNPLGGGGDSPLRQYVWGQYVDELIQQRDLSGGSADYNLLSDLLYRSVALTDSAKAIVETYDTDAYGNTQVFSAPDGGNWFGDHPATTHNPRCRYVFTGREFDSETQIYWYRARYYSSVWGGFLSKDPLGYHREQNLYLYAGAAPHLRRDASGMTSVYPTNVGPGPRVSASGDIWWGVALYAGVNAFANGLYSIVSHLSVDYESRTCADNKQQFTGNEEYWFTESFRSVDGTIRDALGKVVTEKNPRFYEERLGGPHLMGTPKESATALTFVTLLNPSAGKPGLTKYDPNKCTYGYVRTTYEYGVYAGTPVAPNPQRGRFAERNPPSIVETELEHKWEVTVSPLEGWPVGKPLSSGFITGILWWSYCGKMPVICLLTSGAGGEGLPRPGRRLEDKTMDSLFSIAGFHLYCSSL